MLRAILLVALAVSSSALVTKHASVSQKSPLAKVINLLRDMKSGLDGEMKEDEKVHEELGCWCKAGLKEQTAVVDAAGPRVSRLEATMGQSESKVAQLKEQKAEVTQVLRKDTEALSESQGLRMKESKTFSSSRNDLTGSIDSIKQAMITMGKKASLAQMQSMAQQLLDARVSSVAMEHAQTLSRESIEGLHSYLHNVVGASSFLAMSSSAPQGGQIVGMLDQMKEEFEKSLSEAEANEAKSQKEFDDLQSVKQGEIDSHKKSLVAIASESAEAQEKYAHASKALKQTNAQLAIDSENLAKTTATCSASEEEYDTRVKDRNTEIQAVAETIELLNSDDTFDAFNKPGAGGAALVSFLNNGQAAAPAFLQIQARQEQKSRRQQAVSMIQKFAASSESPQLALLAVTAKTEGFDSIAANIDKFVAALNAEGKEEVEHRDWCNGEFQTNSKETGSASDNRDNLVTKIATLQSQIAGTKTELHESEATVADLQKQMEHATELRKENHADLQKTISDHTMMAGILRKAVGRMKQVYAFFQEQEMRAEGQSFLQEQGTPHMKLSGGAPARFSKAAKNHNGGTVVKMLQDLLAGSEKTLNDSKAADAKDQEDFEDSIKDSNRAIKVTQYGQPDMRSQIAEAKEDLNMAKSDLGGTMTTLEGLNSRKGTLHKSCDYIVNNLESRQTARADQMSMLADVKNALRGSA